MIDGVIPGINISEAPLNEDDADLMHVYALHGGQLEAWMQCSLCGKRRDELDFRYGSPDLSICPGRDASRRKRDQEREKTINRFLLGRVNAFEVEDDLLKNVLISSELGCLEKQGGLVDQRPAFVYWMFHFKRAEARMRAGFLPVLDDD